VKFITATDRYIFRLTVMPMLAVFLIAASLLILDKMLKLFDFVATEGGPVSVVFRMLANLLPEYAGNAIPLGMMLGILLAFRKLATSSELDVMRAVGLSYNRLLRVPYMICGVLMVVNLLIVSYLQPLSHYWYEQLQYDLRSGALGASIKVGEFTTLQDKMALRIEQSQDEGRRLQGISAREGQFLALRNNPDTIILRLKDGQIIQEGPKVPPRLLSFTRHDLPIELPAVEKFRQRGGAEKEYVLPELLKIGWSDKTPTDLREASQASLNFRLVEVMMMIFLPLLAVALAVPPKRSSSALGVFLSVVMVTAYHKVAEYGQNMVAQGRGDPLLLQWGPYVLFAALILWMYWRIAYVPGGQPIGALERFVENLGKRLRALWSRRAPRMV
jgi:lipopolysaccharide export system permease protein